jgi:putative tryptophan/tyrosine transport system substrate-binding protein
MKKKITFLTLAAMLFVLCSSAEAQQSGKVSSIGFLDGSTASGMAGLLEAFRRRLDEFENAFKTASRAKAGAILVLPTSILNINRKRIADLATKNRLPTMLATSQHMDAGALMSYGPDYADLYRRAAVFVDKILKGAKPADLPVEQPMKFELVINLKTAKQIVLTIPPNVLVRADRVIR